MNKEIVIERRHVKEDGFVIEKELREKGEVLREQLENRISMMVGKSYDEQITSLVFLAIYFID